MVISRRQFGRIRDQLSGGGFTVHPDTGKKVTSGTTVGDRGNEKRIPVGQSKPRHLDAYHASQSKKFAQGRKLGGWRSETEDVYDTPALFPNTPEGKSGARRKMVKDRQEAEFHLDNFQEEFNPFNPEGRRKSGREGHELADAAAKNPAFALRQPEVRAWVNHPTGQAKATAKIKRAGKRP